MVSIYVLLIVFLIAFFIAASVGKLWFHRRLRRPRRVLAVAAHADYLERACGGTLAKFLYSGHKVRGLVMSAGRQGGDALELSLDAQRGAAFMGLTGMTHHNFTDALRVRGIASFRGGQARRRVAEAYEPVRLLSTEMESL